LSPYLLSILAENSLFDRLSISASDIRAGGVYSEGYAVSDVGVHMQQTLKRCDL